MAKVLGAVELGVIAAIFAGGPAFADSYTINSYSVPNGTSLTANETSPAVTKAENAGSGIANITDTTTTITSNITVFSSSITSTTLSGSYSLAAMTGLTTPPTGGFVDATKVSQLNALLSAVADGQLNPNSATTGAALQAAIWTIFYESGDTGYNVTSGNFYISGSGLTTVEADATNYLTYVTNGTWLATSGDSVFQYTNGSNESLIYLGVTGTGKPVIPEPGSLALIATGLVGIAALRRRRRAHALS